MSKRPVTGRGAALVGALLAGVALVSLALALPFASHATTPKAPKPPHTSTGIAVHAGESTVALNGTVNPHGQETTCYFQYGPTTAYGAQTPTAAAGSGTTSVKISQVVTGLQAGTTYHYRIVAISAGGPSDGQDRTFTTKQIPLKFVIAQAPKVAMFGSPFTLAGTLSGTGGANHQVVLQASRFPYLSGFANLGTPASTNAEGGFSLPVASLSQTTKLRVSTLDALPAFSQVVTVHVAVLVSIHARRTGRGLVRLTGTVTPAETGAQVVFQWIRSGRSPVKVGSAVVTRGTASTSRFGATLSIRHSGYYRALVKVSNGRQVSGSSRTLFLRGAPTVRKAHPHR
ncbi:MAG: hypothetical protein ACRDLF_10470 [Solirubrobacteraceae bacterium]